MFSNLLLRLTASFILKLLLLVAFFSSVTYILVSYYIGASRDQALREKVATEYAALGLPVPAKLPLPNKAKDKSDTNRNWQFFDDLEEVYYDNDTESFVTPLDAQARLVTNLIKDSSERPETDLVDSAAVQAARENGSDLRTVTTNNGTHLRLLTYRLPPSLRISYVQVSRLLEVEDRIKQRLLIILAVCGILLTAVASSFSWMLTGRSLRSTTLAWERQQTFVANASHELRTPLTIIRVSAQVVQQNLAPDDPQRLLMDDVLSETDHMAKLVDDLLLLSRLDASQLKLDLHAIELSDLLPRIQRQFAVLAHECGVIVQIDRTEGVIRADPTRLWQVLLILVDNAIHHTPANGQITLSSQVSGETIQISVTDTGSGIAAADLPHVFERFYKAHNRLADKHSAGLGLAIAKPLIELHGGKITIDSTLGAGTRVTASLPAHRASQILARNPMLEPV